MPETTLTLVEHEAAIAPVRPRPFRLTCDAELGDTPNEFVAKVMGVSPRTVQRWRINGVDGLTGDKLAVKVVGVDGYTLWGSDFDRAFDSILVEHG